MWNTDTQCGLVHRGTLYVVIALCLIAFGLLMATLLLPKRAEIVIAGVAALTAIAVTAVLSIKVAGYDEPVLRRGWLGIRNGATVASIVLFIVACSALIGRRLRHEEADAAQAHGDSNDGS
jgi:hypothetical protein